MVRVLAVPAFAVLAITLPAQDPPGAPARQELRRDEAQVLETSPGLDWARIRGWAARKRFEAVARAISTSPAPEAAAHQMGRHMGRLGQIDDLGHYFASHHPLLAPAYYAGVEEDVEIRKQLLQIRDLNLRRHWRLLLKVVESPSTDPEVRALALVKVLDLTQKPEIREFASSFLARGFPGQDPPPDDLYRRAVTRLWPRGEPWSRRALEVPFLTGHADHYREILDTIGRSPDGEAWLRSLAGRLDEQVRHEVLTVLNRQKP